MPNNGNQKFLVQCRTVDGGVYTFGPFYSIKRAEQTLTKVCGGFQSGDILRVSDEKGLVSLTTECFRN